MIGAKEMMRKKDFQVYDMLTISPLLRAALDGKVCWPLPPARWEEQRVLANLDRVFSLYSFFSINHPSMESQWVSIACIEHFILCPTGKTWTWCIIKFFERFQLIAGCSKKSLRGMKLRLDLKYVCMERFGRGSKTVPSNQALKLFSTSISSVS